MSETLDQIAAVEAYLARDLGGVNAAAGRLLLNALKRLDALESAPPTESEAGEDPTPEDRLRWLHQMHQTAMRNVERISAERDAAVRRAAQAERELLEWVRAYDAMRAKRDTAVKRAQLLADALTGNAT